MDTTVMKCNKHCPAYGHTYAEMTGKHLCFCAGKPSTPTQPDAECQYGIEDYDKYWQTLLKKKGGKRA